MRFWLFTCKLANVSSLPLDSGKIMKDRVLYTQNISKLFIKRRLFVYTALVFVAAGCIVLCALYHKGVIQPKFSSGNQFFSYSCYAGPFFLLYSLLAFVFLILNQNHKRCVEIFSCGKIVVNNSECFGAVFARGPVEISDTSFFPPQRRLIQAITLETTGACYVIAAHDDPCVLDRVEREGNFVCRLDENMVKLVGVL